MNHLDLCRLCERSYWGGESLGNVQWLAERASENRLTIAFRGSDEIRDWVTNARFGKTDHEWGHVHRGFLREWESVREAVLASIGDCDHVTWTGHSLGGALATLAAAETRDGVAECVTFGCPRVGDAAFASRYAEVLGSRTCRYVNELDPVTRVPSAVHGYRHVCDPKWFDGAVWHDGMSLAAAAQAALFRWEGWLPLDDVWASHFIANYVAAMEGLT